MKKGENQQHQAADSSSSSMSRSPNLASSSSSSSSSSSGWEWKKTGQYVNPPDPSNPDPATLREQWRFAIRQYSKWYSHAWGTAIFAGLTFFALGWVIKGSNPLPSSSSSSSSSSDKEHKDQSSPPSKG